MAKQFVVAHGGTDLAFGLAKLERGKLYGTRRRIAIDAQERPCTRAALSADGTTLIASGMTGQGYFAPDGRWVARNEMVGLDASGAVVETKPSTLGVAQPLKGPVDPREVLHLELASVYLLTPEADDAPLLTALKAGEVYRTTFNYTAGLEVETAYVIANGEGVFLLGGRPADIPWAEHAVVFVPEAGDSDDSDDLDFDQL